MSETHRSIGVRLPLELYRQIGARVGIDGRRLTDVVLSLLEKGLTTSNSVGSDVEQRLTSIEQRLTALESSKAPPPASPYPVSPVQPVARTAPPVGGYSTDTGLSQADALTAAGFPATPANAGRWCRANGWESPAGWLKAQGWMVQGRKWYRDDP